MLRMMVRGAYDLQKLRIQMGNRMVINFKAKLGMDTTKPEAESDDQAMLILKKLRADYKLLGTAVSKIKFPNPKAALISSLSEWSIVDSYERLLEAEETAFKAMGKHLKTIPIYKNYLADIKGIGPAMAGVIISEIDITKARHRSSLYCYAGLDCGDDGKGRSRRAEHLVVVKYKDKNGDEKERNSITFNPFLKTKLTGVLGPSFLRANNERYRKVYDDYKHRYMSRWDALPEDVKKSGPKAVCKAMEERGESIITPGHAHSMAIRMMVKMFLSDLYEAWRAMEGLPVSEPYPVAKLGMAAHGN